MGPGASGAPKAPKQIRTAPDKTATAYTYYDYYECYVIDNLLAAAEDVREANYKPMPFFGGGEAETAAWRVWRQIRPQVVGGAIPLLSLLQQVPAAALLSLRPRSSCPCPWPCEAPPPSP